MENKVLAALQVAKQTIDGWTRDSEGRVTVHPDAISKAVNAAIAAMEENMTSEHALPSVPIASVLAEAATVILRNPDTIYYGPHPCENCAKTICRVSREQGGMAFDYPEGIIYPNTNWVQHECRRQMESN